MGRELKRVCLDFDWPLNKVWRGYINPYYKPCPEENVTCFSGYKPEYHWLEAITRQMALIGEEAAAAPRAEEFKQRGRTYPHPYLENWGNAPRYEIPRDEMEKIQAKETAQQRMFEMQKYLHYHPRQLMPLGPGLVSLIEGLSGNKLGSFLGGSGVAWDLMEKILRTAGFTTKSAREEWMHCPLCKGENIHPDMKEAYEAWQKEEPEIGEGWQLWETVSEGSPISPVFPTREAFIEYLIGEGYSPKAAEKFTETGWVPSGLMANGRMYKNIEMCELGTEDR